MYARQLYNLIAEKQIILKCAKCKNRHFFFKDDYTTGQHTHEKMLTDHQRNANQNYNESPVRMTIIKKIRDNKS